MYLQSLEASTYILRVVFYICIYNMYIYIYVMYIYMLLYTFLFFMNENIHKEQ